MYTYTHMYICIRIHICTYVYIRISPANASTPQAQIPSTYAPNRWSHPLQSPVLALAQPQLSFPKIQMQIHCHTVIRMRITCNTLPLTATHCDTLQHTTTHCNIHNSLQHAATHCNTLHHTTPHSLTGTALMIQMLSLFDKCLRFCNIFLRRPPRL